MKISWILLAGYGLGLAVIPHVLLAKKRPGATLAWVWFILLAPYLGVLLYFALGTDRLRRRRLRQAEARARGPSAPSAAASDLLAREVPARQHLLRSLAAINELPASSACEPRLLIDASEFYPALEEAIRGARAHIHIEFYVWQEDAVGRRFLQLLVEACQRGVEVRLLLDQMGCMRTRTAFFEPLRAAGGRFSWFYSGPYHRHLRFVNLRNHRKLQIVDGAIAFVGGMNVGQEHLGAGESPSWRDAQIELRGEILAQLQECFATDWFFATGEELRDRAYYPACAGGESGLAQVVAGGPDLPREPVAKSLVALCTAAERRLWLATGYFCPDNLIVSALQICAARGVDVRLLVSEKNDHPYLVRIGRSFYADLLRFGVRVYEYSAGINHTKAILFDDDWLMVGSANSDHRSMRLNFELNVLLRSKPAAARLEAMLTTDFAASTEMHLREFTDVPLPRRLLEAALRPLAPML